MATSVTRIPVKDKTTGSRTSKGKSVSRLLCDGTEFTKNPLSTAGVAVGEGMRVGVGASMGPASVGAEAGLDTVGVGVGVNVAVGAVAVSAVRIC